jgi:hypothetical protein
MTVSYDFYLTLNAPLERRLHVGEAFRLKDASTYGMLPYTPNTPYIIHRVECANDILEVLRPRIRHTPYYANFSLSFLDRDRIIGVLQISDFSLLRGFRKIHSSPSLESVSDYIHSLLIVGDVSVG